MLNFKGSVNAYRKRSGGLGLVQTNPEPLPGEPAQNLHWSAELVGQLRRLDADWLWLTSWFELAPLCLDPLLHVRSVGSLPWREDTDQYGKWEALVADQALNPRPFVWLEDDATSFFDETQLPVAVSHLVLTPDYQVGVTRAQLEQVKTFLTSLSN